jgi:hypothetical protein
VSFVFGNVFNFDTDEDVFGVVWLLLEPGDVQPSAGWIAQTRARLWVSETRPRLYEAERN